MDCLSRSELLPSAHRAAAKRYEQAVQFEILRQKKYDFLGKQPYIQANRRRKKQGKTKAEILQKKNRTKNNLSRCFAMATGGTSVPAPDFLSRSEFLPSVHRAAAKPSEQAVEFEILRRKEENFLAAAVVAHRGRSRRIASESEGLALVAESSIPHNLTDM